MKAIFLAETEKQVEGLLARQNADKASWIALTPFAMDALDVRSIMYKTPDDFYNGEDLWRIGLELDDIEKEVFSRLDRFAFSNSKELTKRGLKLFTNYSYPLHVIFDTVFIRVFHLNTIFESIGPDEVVYYKSGIYPFYNWRDISYISFDQREFLYSRILDECEWSKKIRFVSLEMPNETGSDEKEPCMSCRKTAAFKIWFNNKFPLLRQVKKYGLHNFLRILPSYFRKNINLALIGGEYDWSRCEFRFNMNRMRLKKLDIDYDAPPQYVKDENLEQEIYKEIKDLLIFRGIDVNPLLLSRLAFVYKEGQNRCIKAYDDVIKYIFKFKPAALLFATLPMPEWKSGALAFSQKNIPIFCKPHGALGITELLKVMDNDLLHTNYYLANGDGDAKAIEKYIDTYKHNNLKIISTGSPRLEQLKNVEVGVPENLKKWLEEKNRENIKDKKIGLYVTSNYFQNFYYVCFKPSYSDTTLFKTQKTIIDFFTNRKDSLLIWKLHPNHICDRPPYIENGLDNVFSIRSEAPFINLLDISDFVIIDSAFTTCQEALTRKVPVFIVMKHVFYFPEARRPLERRAVCCEEPEELMKKVEDFLLHGTYGADVDDDTFLKNYGLGDSRLSAAEKTFTEVYRSVKNGRSSDQYTVA